MAQSAPPLDDEAKAAFDQEKTRARMRELEQRMYALSQLLRESEPKHASRLMIALQTSRQAMILENMQQVRDLIEAEKYDQAQARSQEILKQLEQLKSMLLADDLDLKLLLAQLEKLEQAQKELEKITADQQRLAAVVAQMKPDADRRHLEMVKRDQDDNQSSTDKLAQQLKALLDGGAPVVGPLGGAGQSMNGASEKLAQRQPDQAGENQQQALDKLAEAAKALEQARQVLHKQIQDQMRQQVIASLRQMIKQQSDIREALQTLREKPPDAAGGIEAAVKRLASPQQDLIDHMGQLLELLESTQFSLVLPHALSAVQRDMVQVAYDLRRAASGQPVVDRMVKIGEDLGRLLETFEQQASQQQQIDQAPAGDPNAAEAQKQSRLLAELRMLRLLEQQVHDQTRALDQQRLDSGEVTLAMQSEMKLLADQQRQLADLAQRLDRMQQEDDDSFGR